MTGGNAPIRFCDRIIQLCVDHPDAPAIEFEEQWTSWGDVGLRTSALRSTLRAAGVDPTDPVGLVVRERPPAVGALLALLSEGQPVVLIQSLASDDEIGAELGRLELAAVVAEARDWDRDRFGDHVRSAGMVGVRIGDEPADVARISTLWDAAPLRPGSHESSVPEPGVAVLVPTSGTTGPPRRYPVTTATLDEVRTGVAVRDPAQSQGATINTVPLSSVGGLLGLVSTVWRGRPIALMERFDVDRWVALVREHRPRRIGVPPAIINTIVDRDFPREWFESVRYLATGSAPLDAVAARRFADRYGIAVLNAYGATEFGGPVVAWLDDDWEQWNQTKLGSAGRALAGVDLRLVPTASATEEGAGILEVRKDGGRWIPTNDMARIDADGFVWILQRVDDVIVRGGFKVRAADVEDALAAHERVDEVVVVGIPDPRLGSVPAAMVTVHPGAAPITGEDLRDHVRARLASYKVPVVVRIVDQIPRNAMMKPRRAQIRDALAGET